MVLQASVQSQVKRCDVAICGGGLAGLALASGLHARGYDVQLFEAAPVLRTATSTLIGLGQNAFTALDELHPAIVPEIQARGAKNLKRKIITITSPDVEPVVESSSPLMVFYTIKWAEVQNVLADNVPSDIIHLNHRAIGYTEEDGYVTVHFKDQSDVEARLLVAADGVRSALRAVMVPDDPGPRYLGHMNWNAVIYNPDQSVVDAHEPGDIQVTVDVPMGQWTVMAYVIDSGQGHTFWQVRQVHEEPSFTPLPDSGLANSKEITDAQPYLVGGGLNKPGSKARVEHMLAAAGFDNVLSIVKATPESAIFERALMDRIPLDEGCARMHSLGNRVVLVGDAAHAMHPGPGMGARSAFEDVHTLAALLDKHRSELAGWAARDASTAAAAANSDRSAAADKAGLSKVMSEYNHLRLTRTCRIQRVAAENCGIPSIRQQAQGHVGKENPLGHVTKESRTRRFLEFYKWIDQYPMNPTGDPASEFWKPTPSPEKEGATNVL